MAMFVPASTANPVPPTTVTSLDGFLTAVLYQQSVYLVADFGNTAVRKVRFTRTPDQLVRSGNDRWAPSGRAHAYDNEAPQGVASTWIATPIDKTGALGAPSQAVSLTIPKLTGAYNSWLKSTEQPGLSMPVFVVGGDSLPSFTHTARNQLSQVQGSPFQAGAWDKHLNPSPTLVCYTDADINQDQMNQLLDSGPLLFQTDPDYRLNDFYFLPDDVTMDLNGSAANLTRKWTIGTQQIDRPTPYGAPLIIPGRSYQTVKDGFASYAALKLAYPSFDAMVGPVVQAGGGGSDAGEYPGVSFFPGDDVFPSDVTV